MYQPFLIRFKKQAEGRDNVHEYTANLKPFKVSALGMTHTVYSNVKAKAAEKKNKNFHLFNYFLPINHITTPEMYLVSPRS